MTLRLLLFSVLSCAPGVGAAFFSLPDTITGRILDEATGKPLAPVFLVASEEYRASSIGHGSVSRCVRGGAATGTTAEGARIALPFASRGFFTGLSSDGGLSVMAYTPGYCVLPQWTSRGSVHEFRARRNTDPREHRIRYIGTQAVRFLTFACGGGEVASGTADARREMASAAAAEASRIAETPFERYLAERIAHAAAGRDPDAARLPSGRSFAIVDANRRTSRIDWKARNTTCRGCSRIDAPSAHRAGDPPPQPLPQPNYVVVCRAESECDLERRSASGSTYLYELIEDGDAPRAKALLAKGADPNAERFPGGPTGLDMLLAEARDGKADRAERALETIRLLAADGRATVRRSVAQSLRDKASASQDAQHRELLVAIAAVVDGFPERPAFAPACPVSEQFMTPFQPPRY